MMDGIEMIVVKKDDFAAVAVVYADTGSHRHSFSE